MTNNEMKRQHIVTLATINDSDLLLSGATSLEDHDDLQLFVDSETLEPTNALMHNSTSSMINDECTLTNVGTSVKKKQKRPGGWPKGKKRKPETITFPRPALTAYLMYSKERRKQIKEQFTDLPLPKVTKMIGNEWSAMSKEQKHEYEKLSEEDKKRFHADLQEFKHTMEQHNEDTHESYFNTEDITSSGYHCKICDMYFNSLNNKEQHTLGKSHQAALKKSLCMDEFQLDLDEGVLHIAQNLGNEETIETSVQSTAANKNKTSMSDYVQLCLEKNREEELELRELGKYLNRYEHEQSKLRATLCHLQEKEKSLKQEFSMSESTCAELSIQIDQLYMVPSLFGVNRP